MVAVGGLAALSWEVLWQLRSTLALGASVGSAQETALGKGIYDDRCAVCHGSTGSGDGIVGELFATKPKNLTMLAADSGGAFPFSEVYQAIDGSGFYRGAARPECRSPMNVTFTTPSAELDARFVEEAAAQGMSGLKGHRSVGGMRASLYNAFPRAGCEALARFMADFEKKHG